jgi:hypothetical protein
MGVIYMPRPFIQILVLTLCLVVLAMAGCAKGEGEYQPPDIAGLLDAIADSEVWPDGEIVITADIKRQFNHMGEDYLFFFMPAVEWYQFESTGAAVAYVLFTWTGEFGTFPDQVPKDQVEARLQQLFAAPDDEYPRLVHQLYPKYARFDGDHYSPWPEGYNDNAKLYDLQELSKRAEGDDTYYTAVANEYQFCLDALQGYYEMGPNEEFLFNAAERMGLDYQDTLAQLLTSGEIAGAQASVSYKIVFRVPSGGTVPMIVSVDRQ